MRKLLFWIVWNVPLGILAPYVLGLALGSMPHRIDKEQSDLFRQEE